MNKKIVILANSRKLSGKCVAGKDEDGEWIRLTKNGHNPIPVIEARNYYMLKIIEAEGLINTSSTEFNYHTENSIYTNVKLLGNLDLSKIDNLTDNPIDIFGTGKYVIEEDAQNLNQSLIFVKVTNFSMYYKHSGQYGDKLRGQFTYKKKNYSDMAVTDTFCEERFALRGSNYQESYRQVYITVSLGEIFNGAAYKLISGVVIP